MDQDRWARAQRLFEETLKRKIERRRAFLDEACGDDAELRAEVDSLLHHYHAASTGFMEPPERHGGEPSAVRTPRPSAQTEPIRQLGIDAVQALVGNRYRIVRAAGAGGMGQVFEATDTVLQRRVAIKVLHGAAAGMREHGDPDDRERKRVLTEARAMAGLRHPNLCPVHEVSVHGALPFIVMDWIDGIDLRTAWRNADINHRLVLFVRLVEAIAEAHAVGVVHGDLKPSNILVDRMGTPFVVDFGLARSGADSVTRWRMWGGTPGYAAPEQFDEEEPVGPEADVYGLGAIMYEMLTDRLPFTAASAAELVQLIREQDPALPETHAPNVPWPLQRICLVALERDPQRRYVDAHAMATDLQRYLRGESVAARPSMLADQFIETVEQHIEQVESWRRQGLVTDPESNRLSRALSGLLRPEQHWILDSRRLSASQVTLYLGGWFVVIAITIGMYHAWTALGEYRHLRYGIAWSVFAMLLLSGLWIQRRGHRRIALGYLVVACLVSPVATGLIFHEMEWLGDPMTECRTWLPWETAAAEEFGADISDMTLNREWFHVFLSQLPIDGTVQGLLNRQMLVLSIIWLAASLAFRRLAQSSAFTTFSVLAAGTCAVMVWASLGLLSEVYRAYAMLGLWVFIVGALAFAPGLWLNRREELQAQQIGRARMTSRDSWAVLSGSVIMITVGLLMMAWNAGDMYTFQTMQLLDFADSSSGDRVRSTVAVALIVNGIVLQVAAYALERRRTIVRSRLAEVIRWITPSHVLGGVLLLHSDPRGGDLQQHLWLIILAILSVAFCYLSARKQWRPFLFNGLFYLAVTYWRTFEEVKDALGSSDRRTTYIVLVIASVLIGLVIMFGAWKVPVYLARLKLVQMAGGRSGRFVRSRWMAWTLVSVIALLAVFPSTHYLRRLSSPENRLLGTWELRHEGRLGSLLRFRSEGIVELTRDDEITVAEYTSDFSTNPAQLNLALPGMGELIAAFEGDKLRLEKSDDGSRPQEFGSDSLLLERAPYWRRLALAVNIMALVALVICAIWTIPRWENTLRRGDSDHRAA